MSGYTAAAERELRGIFQRRYFANNGPLVQGLDREFARVFGYEHAVAVVSPAVAVALAAKALCAPGRIYVPAGTREPLCEALRWAGCEVSVGVGESALAYVSRDSGDDEACAAALARAADAAMRSIVEGSGWPLGRAPRGDITMYALDACVGVLGAGGAMLATDRDDLADALRTMRNFHANETFADVPLRLNAKMSEAQAALVLAALELPAR